jgi:hypothetical protein
MTLPWPADTRLARDTDVFIRDLALATDAALAAAVKTYTASGSQACDANGDIIIDFGAAVTLTGCLALVRGVDDPPVMADARIGDQRNAYYPPPYADRLTMPLPLLILPREFVPGQGKCYCRIGTSPIALNAPPNGSTGRWYGTMPARGGTVIEFAAFGWVS